MDAPQPMREAISVDAGYSLHRAACPVCGHGFEARPVICPSCEAPHHEDCWRYVGGCTTYGCSARFRPPRPAADLRRGALAASLHLPVPAPRRRSYLDRPSDEAGVMAACLFLCALLASTLGGAALLVALAAAVLLVSSLTTEAYQLDLVAGVFRCTKGILGRRLVTLPVCALEDVAYLDVGPPLDGGDGCSLVCALKTGEKVVLLPRFEAAGTQGLAVDAFCQRVAAATRIGIGARPRHVSPIAEAMAEALARHETPARRRGRPFL